MVKDLGISLEENPHASELRKPIGYAHVPKEEEIAWLWPQTQSKIEAKH